MFNMHCKTCFVKYQCLSVISAFNQCNRVIPLMFSILGQKMSFDVANNIIKHIQQRRGSAPCDTYSEFKKSNFYFAVNCMNMIPHKKPLLRRSSGEMEQSQLLLASDELNSENLIWYRWIHRSRCDNSYAKTKRRGSLPVEVLAMTGKYRVLKKIH